MMVATLVLLALLAGCGSSSGAPAPGPTASATAGTTGAAGPPYPTPQEETYQGCPPAGDGGDAALNMLKNRIDTGTWQPVSVQDLLALTWPAGIEKTQRRNWSPADAQTVAQSEGRPVVAEGYLLMLRHEGPESPNCHDRSARDYHVWLAVSSSDDRSNSMVVELTPRVVAMNPGWGSEQNILHLAGHHVRVSGWLLLDQEHPEQLHKTRGTLWEIHPVMKVEVDQGGSWANLASGTVALGNGVARTTGSQGQSTGNTGTSGGSSSARHHRTRHRRHRSS
jgi:hypothetical protein